MDGRLLPRRIVFFIFVLGTIGVARIGSTEPAPAPPFVVIVHPQNPHPSLDRGFIADAFLKKTTRWPDGDVIKPVDLPPSSTARVSFSQSVLRRSVAAVKSYWQQMIFSGRDVPPPELANDDIVVKYVTTHPDAIGYVSGETRLGDARVVTVR